MENTLTLSKNEKILSDYLIKLNGRKLIPLNCFKQFKDKTSKNNSRDHQKTFINCILKSLHSKGLHTNINFID
jgi:hypothetical protein